VSELRFKDQVAVITGGASGIGLAIAEQLQKEGARISIWDRAETSSFAHSVKLDVTDEAAVNEAAAAAFAMLGRIDILVASAGITGPTLPVVDYQLADWRQVIEVNLVGAFLCNRAVVPYMLKHDYGRIINISSVAGKEGNPNASAYSASKAGLIGLTKSLGKELAKTGIRVNAITPAAADTPIFEQMKPEHIAYMLSKIPMGRFVDIGEITAMVAWMASQECSFTTGAVFDITGGRSTY
jgi:NAD(P)-dependent dehydrogenase (short-subunit alcohol dehydrogenase family)